MFSICIGKIENHTHRKNSVTKMQAIPTIQIRQNGVVTYDSYLEPRNKTGTKQTLKQNLSSVYSDELKEMNKEAEILDYQSFIKKYHTTHENHRQYSNSLGVQVKPLGTVSDAVLRKMKKYIDLLTSTAFFTYKKNQSYKSQTYITFLTLTLPSKQFHHDNVLNKCLIRLLENLKKTYQLQNYIWKAEAQKNGNIHYHILLDKWIQWQHVQRLWNKQLDKFGYVQNFKASHGDKEPNTIKIHSLKKVKNTVGYILKYMTKQEKGKRPVIGRMWGSSRNLKKVDYLKIYSNEKAYDDLDELAGESEKSIEIDKEQNIYFFIIKNCYKAIKQRYRTLYGRLKNHFRDLNYILQNGAIPFKTVQQII